MSSLLVSVGAALADVGLLLGRPRAVLAGNVAFFLGFGLDAGFFFRLTRGAAEYDAFGNGFDDFFFRGFPHGWTAGFNDGTSGCP